LKLGYNLNLEQTQKLIMTPELRQAIQLLQYNSLELNEYLSKELEENPMLELEGPQREIEAVEIDKKDHDIDWKEYLEKFDDISYREQTDRNIKEYNLEAFTRYSPSLREHLLFQLCLLKINRKDHKIAEYIIQNIDNNGYLIASIDEISKMTQSSLESVTRVLGIIQGFEPTGVGARDLKECLMLQVKENDPSIIRELIENYLEDIANNRLNKIAKENDIDINMVQKACDYIKSLEPKPGRAFLGNSDETKYIIPDATILLVDGEYIIQVNDYTGPRLNINNYYRNLIRDGGDVKTTEFLQEKFNSAMWIIRSIEQRRQTIYRVVESILKYQMEFFKNGEKALVPLTLKEIAEDINMHESTISRATNGKYVQTPRGLFELKYFFSAGLAGLEGDVSSTCIKALIKELIDKEDCKKPLSDSQISKLLEQKGTKVSRRTIAKYRDEMNIPASTLRKRY
jgi:RNA polymerase sigma-54 factor